MNIEPSSAPPPDPRAAVIALFARILARHWVRQLAKRESAPPPSAVGRAVEQDEVDGHGSARNP